MRYRGAGKEDQARQLGLIGLEYPNDLFARIPAPLLDPDFKLPGGLAEIELLRKFDRLISEQGSRIPPQRSFLGGGRYHHFIPSAVQEIASDSSFSTAYTPYQAEASQGTLQSLFEYQSYLAELLSMDIVNASHYSGACALAEAVRLAILHKGGSGEKCFAFLGKLAPEMRETIETYCQALEVRFLFYEEEGDIDVESLGAGFSGLCALSPDYFGRVRSLEGLAAPVHAAGGLFLVHTDPLACACFRPPGSWDADIATAEGQSLGSPPNFGGPGLGIFAVRKELVRNLPGRLCGQTRDADGRRMFVLTLSAREQHIRREKAFSNICTNQGLAALRALAYMALLGPSGLEELAQACLRNGEVLRRSLTRIKGIEILGKGPRFRDHAFRLPIAAALLRKELLAQGFDAGIPLDSCSSPRDILFTVTEIHREDDIMDLAQAIRGIIHGPS